jgi:hypothetical protein
MWNNGITNILDLELHMGAYASYIVVTHAI